MGRQKILLKGIKTKNSVGIEIGPLDKPLVKKNQGNIFYVDHCNTESLKSRWSTDPNINTRVLHVDVVWGGEVLPDALTKIKHDWMGADYVLASHVIEHVPDLITWLNEIFLSLKPNGILRLAIPDKRYTFDYNRRTTNLTEVADAFICRRRVPSSSRVLDFTLNMIKNIDCCEVWRGNFDDSKFKKGYTKESAFELARDAEENETYHDVHCWVFTPHSFVNLMKELAQYGLLDFKCEWIIPTKRNTLEFFVSMTPTSSKMDTVNSWINANKLLDLKS